MKKKVLTVVSLVVALACCLSLCLAACNNEPHTEHVWDDGVEQKAATCYAEGATLYTCTVKDCGKTKTEPIATLEHSWDDGTPTKAPSCTQAGVTKYECTVNGCNATKEEPIDMLEHEWGDWENSVTQVGKQERVCDVCGKVETRDPTIPPPCEHTYTEDGWIEAETGATCIDAKAVGHYECAICGEWFDQDDVKIATAARYVYGDHDWDEGEVTREPTTTREGERTFECQTCGDHKTEVIDKLEGEPPVGTDNNASYGEDFSLTGQGEWTYGKAHINEYKDDKYDFDFEALTDTTDDAWTNHNGVEIKSDWICSEGEFEAAIRYTFAKTGAIKLNFNFYGDDDSTNMAIRISITRGNENIVISGDTNRVIFVGAGKDLTYTGTFDVQEGDVLTLIFCREPDAGFYHGHFDMTITDETPVNDNQAATQAAYIDVTKQNGYEQI